MENRKPNPPPRLIHDIRPPSRDLPPIRPVQRIRPTHVETQKPETTVHITPAVENKKKSRRGGKIFFLLHLLGLSLVGLLSVDATLGQLFVAAFGVFAIFRKLPSRYGFLLALFCIAAVPIFQLTGRDKLAENYAIYGYYFLLIGLVISLLELFLPKKAKRIID